MEDVDAELAVTGAAEAIVVAIRGPPAVRRPSLASSRRALCFWKNPEHLTGRQDAKLGHVARTNDRLHRASLLKEQLRRVFQLGGHRALTLLDDWLVWDRCGDPVR